MSGLSFLALESRGKKETTRQCVCCKAKMTLKLKVRKHVSFIHGTSFTFFFISDDSTSASISNAVDNLGGLPSIYRPFIIVGGLIIFSAVMFLPLAVATGDNQGTLINMPIHDDDEKKEKRRTAKEEYKHLAKWLPFLVQVFLFYWISCAIERIFQSSVYTFGLCGPLELDPQGAAVSDNSYNGGFMVGRVVGTAVAAFLKPRTMLAISLSSCLAASIILSIFGPISSTGLYLGSALVGFAVSWQYGSAFSWHAYQIYLSS